MHKTRVRELAQALPEHTRAKSSSIVVVGLAPASLRLRLTAASSPLGLRLGHRPAPPPVSLPFLATRCMQSWPWSGSELFGVRLLFLACTARRKTTYHRHFELFYRSTTRGFKSTCSTRHPQDGHISVCKQQKMLPGIPLKSANLTGKVSHIRRLMTRACTDSSHRCCWTENRQHNRGKVEN